MSSIAKSLLGTLRYVGLKEKFQYWVYMQNGETDSTMNIYIIKTTETTNMQAGTKYASA